MKKIIYLTIFVIVFLVILIFSFRKNQNLFNILLPNYKQTNSIKLYESHFHSRSGSLINFDIFVKKDSYYTIKKIQLIDKLTGKIINQPATFVRELPDYNGMLPGWLHYSTKQEKMREFFGIKNLDSREPIPSNRYVINVFFKDVSGKQFFTQKTSEGIYGEAYE